MKQCEAMNCKYTNKFYFLTLAYTGLQRKPKLQSNNYLFSCCSYECNICRTTTARKLVFTAMAFGYLMTMYHISSYVQTFKKNLVLLKKYNTHREGRSVSTWHIISSFLTVQNCNLAYRRVTQPNNNFLYQTTMAVFNLTLAD